jgi:hypothetical protein
VSFLGPPAESASGFFATIGAAFLAVVTFVGVVARAIAARWRGILLTHIFFLTLWLAIQVFSFAKDAFAYIRDNVPTWFSKVEVPSAPLPKVSSSKPLTNNCWRDRSLDGNCFTQTETRRKAAPARPRILAQPPCYRFYRCGSDDI